jgi:PAS domain S-box-containing protein
LPEEKALNRLVVIGASAGGTEALSTVLRALAPDFPVPIVVALHGDPTQSVQRDAMLVQHTRLAVRTLAEAERLAAGTAYLMPANQDVEIDGDEAHLRPDSGPAKPPISRLLRSAARARGEQLIAVILAGTGSDGAAGARAVKAAGGTVVVEEPATAAFSETRHVSTPASVDVVARLDEIGPLLRDLLAGTFRPVSPGAGPDPQASDSDAGRVNLPAPGWGARGGHEEPGDMALLLETDITGAEQKRPLVNSAATAHHRGRPERMRRRSSGRIARLRAELERMRAVNRELKVATRELGASNLEMQRISDELRLAREREQAAGDAMRANNEELLARNAEQGATNEQLKAAVEELCTAYNDLAARSQETTDALAIMAGRLKQESESERARLAAILSSIGDAVLVVDQAGAPLLTNMAYERIFGDTATPFAAADADGLPLPSADTPSQRAAQGETFTMEFTLAAADGTRRWFEANGRPIHSAGEERGGVVTFCDISERSLPEMQEQFLQLASHELRGPLTVLTGILDYMAGRLQAARSRGTGKDLRQAVDWARRNVERLQNLVADLLDVARLQGGKLRFRREPLDLVALVKRMAAAVQLANPDIPLVVEVPDTAIQIVGDSTRLEQVLGNLLLNALEHAPDSERIDIRLRPAGREAELQVQDYGPGIPEADQPYLFTRFYQVARTGGPQATGLGLGLYLTKQLVNAHGGTIAVESSLGQGTTFIVRLPLLATDEGT